MPPCSPSERCSSKSFTVSDATLISGFIVCGLSAVQVTVLVAIVANDTCIEMPAGKGARATWNWTGCIQYRQSVLWYCAVGRSPQGSSSFYHRRLKHTQFQLEASNVPVINHLVMNSAYAGLKYLYAPTTVEKVAEWLASRPSRYNP
jgi:hypothetical protein